MRIVLGVCASLVLVPLAGSSALAQGGYAPGYGQGGGYGQPRAQQQPAGQPQPARQPRRQLVPYEDGMPMPPGGEVVGRRKPGLWIPGLVVFAVPWVATAAGYAFRVDVTGDSDGGELLAPVVGPWIRAATIDRDDTALEEMVKAALVFDGIAQALGLALFTAGMVERDYVMYWALDGERHLAVTPTFGPDRAGVGLTVW